MNSPFFFHLLNGLLMVGMPLALAAYLTRRFHSGWRLVWIGAATFLISQAGHIPFNTLVTHLFQVGVLPKPPASWVPYFNPIFLGLSAGLFEELARTAVYAWWARDARTWRKGVLFGAGHGGAEAVILGGLALYSLIQMVALRHADLSKLVPPDQLSLAQHQVSAYWSMPWYTALLGALERVFAIPLQITLAVIVLQAFIRRQPAWVGLAILLHALVDALAVYLPVVWRGAPWSTLAVEGVVGAFSVLGVILLVFLCRSEPRADPEVGKALPPTQPLIGDDADRSHNDQA